MYKQKYQNVQPVYHDIETGLTTHDRLTKTQTCFDSTAEYNLYRLIAQYFHPSLFTVGIHPTLKLGNISWKIDFSIVAHEGNYNATWKLAQLVNAIHGTQYGTLQQIFIEYKGYQDSNFITKMHNAAVVAPLFCKSIILVSSHVSAFGTYDSERCRFYCHPILSSAILEKFLQLHI